MVMKKKTILELNFPFIFIFCKGVKENQGLKEANKGLDWLVSFTEMYFPCILYALVVKIFVLCLNVFFFDNVHGNAFSTAHSLLAKVIVR